VSRRDITAAFRGNTRTDERTSRPYRLGNVHSLEMLKNAALA